MEIKYENLTTEEGQLILEALGEMPFKRVFPIVQKLQGQFMSQIKAEEDRQTEIFKKKEEEEKRAKEALDKKIKAEIEGKNN